MENSTLDIAVIAKLVIEKLIELAEKRGANLATTTLAKADENGNLICHLNLQQAVSFTLQELQNVQLLEFQPDWSQAPENANYWTKDEDEGRADWWEIEPELNKTGRYWDFGRLIDAAPTFGYTGDWKASLRKRPVEKN